MEEIYYKGQKIDKDEINESLKQIQNSALFEATEDAQKLMNKKTGGLEFRKKHDKSSHDKIKKIKTMLASFLYQVKYPKRIPEFDKLMKPEKFNTGLFGLKVHYVDPKKPIEDAAKEAEVFFNDLEAKGGGNFKLADFMTGIQHSERQEEKENESVEFISDEDNEQYLIEQYFTQFVPILNEDDSTIDSSNNYIDQSVKDERDKKNNSDEYINNYLGGYVKRIINKLSDSMNALAMTEELSQLISGLNSTLEYVMSGGESTYIDKEFKNNNAIHKLNQLTVNYNKALLASLQKEFNRSGMRLQPSDYNEIIQNINIFLNTLFFKTTLIEKKNIKGTLYIICNLEKFELDNFKDNLSTIRSLLNSQVYDNITKCTKDISNLTTSQLKNIHNSDKDLYKDIDIDSIADNVISFLQKLFFPSGNLLSNFFTNSDKCPNITFNLLSFTNQMSSGDFNEFVNNIK